MSTESVNEILTGFQQTSTNNWVTCYFKKGYDEEKMNILSLLHEAGKVNINGRKLKFIIRLREPNEFREYNTMIVTSPS